jgi:hypothetical protein
VKLIIDISPFRKWGAGGFDMQSVTMKDQIPLNRAPPSTDIQVGAQILAPPYLFLKGENTTVKNYFYNSISIVESRTLEKKCI